MGHYPAHLHNQEINRLQTGLLIGLLRASLGLHCVGYHTSVHTGMEQGGLSEQGLIPEILASEGEEVGSLESQTRTGPGSTWGSCNRAGGFSGLGRAGDAAFLTSSQVMLMLLLWAIL